MCGPFRNSVFGFLGVLMIAAGAVAAAPGQGEPEIAVDLGPTSLAATLPADSYAAATLVVVGPKGFRIERRYRRGEPIVLDLASLRSSDDQSLSYPNGQYKWELRVDWAPQAGVGKAMTSQPMTSLTRTGGSGAAEPVTRSDSGRFVVEDGAIKAETDASEGASVSRGGKPTAVIKTTNTGGNHFVGDLTVASGGVCSGCSDGDSDLHVGELLVKDPIPYITMRDTNDDQLWRWSSNLGPLTLNSDRLAGGSQTAPLVVENDAPNDSLFFDSTGPLGMGTTTPLSNVTLTLFPTPANPFSSGIALANTNASAGHPFLLYQNGEGYFGIAHEYNSEVTPFAIYKDATANRLIISGDNVGIGTFSPDRLLKVEGTDQTTTRVQVTNTSGTTAQRILFKLENNGPTNFAIDNTAISSQWTFAVTNTGFAISKDGSGVQEMVVTGGGNMTIAGTLNQLSDVNAKEDFEALDSADVLAKVAALPVSEWSFKSDGSRIRHVGPMAQDFRAAFGLGVDERHIAPLDAAGVALAAVKALNEKLTAENADLRRRLDRLEALAEAPCD